MTNLPSRADPGQDFEAFVDAAASSVLRTQAAEAALPSNVQAERRLLRSLARLALGVLHDHPPVAQDIYARVVASSLANWSNLREQPDHGGRG